MLRKQRLVRTHVIVLILESGFRLSQYQHPLYKYRNSRWDDETITRPSHLYNGNSYTGKTVALYYNRPRAMTRNIIPRHSCVVWNRKVSLKYVENGYILCGISNKIHDGNFLKMTPTPPHHVPCICVLDSADDYLTHWGRDRIDAISQTDFSNSFSRLKMYEFCLRFHRSSFLRFELTIFLNGFR